MTKRRHLSLWVDRELGAELDVLRDMAPMSRYGEKALRGFVDARVVGMKPPERRAFEAAVSARLAQYDQEGR